MNEKFINQPLYLLIANWAMAKKSWVSAKQIAEKFDIPHCNAINIVSYILASVSEIQCETKTIPNQLEGRGCQCQRLIKVKHIDDKLYQRLKENRVEKGARDYRTQPAANSADNLSYEQKWQLMISKSQRR